MKIAIVSLVKRKKMNLIFDKRGFSQSLRITRIIKKNIGLREAAAEIGVSSSTLSRIENEKDFKIDSILKVCNWLDAHLGDFILDMPIKKRRK